MTWFVELMHRDGSVQTRCRVEGSELRIGRALDNDLVIDDPHCAAHHALLRIEPDGSAVLQDLGTRNGTAPAWGKLEKGGEKGSEKGSKTSSGPSVFTVQNDTPYRAGQSLIRIRNSAWPLAPELVMSSRLIWPFALAALALVLLHTAWQVWLGDVSERSPPYLYGLVGVAAGVSVWSGMYALLGRLIGGVERFFTHLLIASCGYLIVAFAERALDMLSFSLAWLWPLRVGYSVTIVLIALLVRAHLRLADPRHWPTLRWAVALVAALALVVPVAQLWLSSHRLTNVQTLSNSEHPALRLAKPVGVEAMIESTAPLKTRVDALRSKDNTDEGEEEE
jgi:FHA domain